MKQNIQLPFWGLIVLIFSIFLIPSLLHTGVFMDGLIYSNIALNLSEEIGTNWSPVFSETIMSEFQGHPPLVFILQKYFFLFFGNHFYTEKIYSLLTCIFTALFIVGIWKKISSTLPIKSLSWLPLLFWITTPICYWAYNNNMLENTMGLFSIAALYFLILSISQSWEYKIVLITISSACLLASFLSKGFAGLFPLAFFVIYGLCFNKSFSIKKIVSHTLLLVTISGLITFLFFYFHTSAKINIETYFEVQVFKSLKGELAVGSRWHIIWVLIQQLLIILAICFTLVVIKWKSNLSYFKTYTTENRLAFFFFLIALSASLPIMVSPKQLDFYIVPSLPYFALSLAFLVAPIVWQYVKSINPNSIFYKIFKYQILFTLPIIILVSSLTFGEPIRNKILITDVEIMSEIIPQRSTISVSSTLKHHWAFFGYAQRIARINIDNKGGEHNYLLITKGDDPLEGYELIPTDMEEFILYKQLTSN